MTTRAAKIMEEQHTFREATAERIREWRRRGGAALHERELANARAWRTTRVAAALQTRLTERLPLLCGEWVSKNSHYEQALADLLNFECDTKTHWDARFGRQYLEFKKGVIWLNLVRYSKIVLGVSKEARTPTVTLFLFPNERRDRIISIAAVQTSELIKLLRLNSENARVVIKLDQHMPRQLNALAYLTKRDVMRIAEFVVQS